MNRGSQINVKKAIFSRSVEVLRKVKNVEELIGDRLQNSDIRDKLNNNSIESRFQKNIQNWSQPSSAEYYYDVELETVPRNGNIVVAELLTVIL